MTNKDIAMELLEKWVEDEISLMWEYSYDFDNSKKQIWKDAQKYLKRLDSTDIEFSNKLYNKIYD